MNSLIRIGISARSFTKRLAGQFYGEKEYSNLPVGRFCDSGRRKYPGLITVLTSFLVMGVASGDDTEIFFNGETNPPNVMFIVDVSGSMGWTDSSALPNIPGNVLWLDPSDRGTLLDAEGDRSWDWRRFSGRVATWLDKSGKGNHLKGTSATVGRINNRNTVRFTNDIMTGPDLFGGTMDEATIFFIQKENASSWNFFMNFNGDSTGHTRVSLHTPWRSNRNWYWDSGGYRGNRSYLLRPTDVGEITQVTAFKTVSGNQNGISLNGGAVSFAREGASAAVTSGGMHFGRGITDHELGEMLVYDRKLSDTEIKKVEEYLDNKWRTRLQRLKISLNSLLNANDGFNAGLMSYSSYARGQFSLRNEIKPVTESKDSLLTNINALYASGGTPTSSALFEGMLHFRGETPRAMGGIRSSGSPPTVQCQSNHIVLLTDGYPYGRQSEYNNIGSYIGSDCARNQGPNMRGGNCGIEVAKYMKDNDHLPGVRGVNNITTHTIGLSLDIPWLDDIATAGGGGYYTASSSDQLLTAFQSIVDVAIDHATTFVAPSVTVDQFSRLAHREDTYLALFQPNSSMRWPGNLKRYSFSGDPAAIRDQNDKVVLDSTTGVFVDEAQSFWSATPDGAYTSEGGAASRLDASNRKVTTFTGYGTSSLIDQRNLVHEDNADKLTRWFTQTGDELENLLAWTRGIDVDDEDGDGSKTDTRHHMGDPLHSKPVIVNYGGTAANFDSVVFVGTNEGYLHAINTKDGDEIFSFIPPELLGNLNTFYENGNGLVRPYGLDGGLTVWVDDANNNGSVDPSSEHAYLYAGMRRGGRNYYALDVSEKHNPKYLWTIKGGTGNSDFAELGQTWSKPVKSRMKIDGVVKDVLVFGGGYDPAQDVATVRTPDSMGNTVFIVDAVDGSLIWKAVSDNKSDYSKMVYSIPSDPRLVDIDGDSFADQMYVGDMGGQVWRFDINSNATSAADLITGGLIADLATNDGANNRRFFYTPDVAIVAHNGERFLSVALGSGNRSHPLGRTVRNRFYMIRQDDIHNAPEGYGVFDSAVSALYPYRAITEADLYNATANDIESSTGDVAVEAKKALDDASGWLITLDTYGEKVLGSSITVNNNIAFASYLPDNSGQSNNSCQSAAGGNRGYVVSLYDASPISDSETDADPSERYSDLQQPGIAGDTSVIISDDGSVSINAVTGLDSIEVPSINMTKRVYWSEYPNF